MEYMEQKMQEQMEAGEAQMEYLYDVREKLDKFCKENNVSLNEILKSIKLTCSIVEVPCFTHFIDKMVFEKPDLEIEKIIHDNIDDLYES